MLAKILDNKSAHIPLVKDMDIFCTSLSFTNIFQRLTNFLLSQQLFSTMTVLNFQELSALYPFVYMRDSFIYQLNSPQIMNNPFSWKSFPDARGKIHISCEKYPFITYSSLFSLFCNLFRLQLLNCSQEKIWKQGLRKCVRNPRAKPTLD